MSSEIKFFAMAAGIVVVLATSIIIFKFFSEKLAFDRDVIIHVKDTVYDGKKVLVLSYAGTSGSWSTDPIDGSKLEIIVVRKGGEREVIKYDGTLKISEIHRVELPDDVVETYVTYGGKVLDVRRFE